MAFVHLFNESKLHSATFTLSWSHFQGGMMAFGDLGIPKIHPYPFLPDPAHPSDGSDPIGADNGGAELESHWICNREPPHQ